MIPLLLVTALLLIGYALLMSSYRAGWRQIRPFRVPGDFVPQTRICVVVPARNERYNINDCIKSLLEQDYPAHLRQIIVVDDHSVDDTVEIARGYADRGVQCIRMADLPKPAGKAYKKQALAAGIARAEAELILTTDADCTSGTGLLRTVAARYEAGKPVAIIGPVIFSPVRQSVHIFQALDFASMQGITAAIHQRGWGSMANGANLAFQKTAFDAVGGYEGIDHIASGDDLLLVHKLSKHYPGQVAYLKSKDALVSTPPQPDWGSFLEQRVRWASKSGRYGDSRLTAQLLLVYLVNVALLAIVWDAIFGLTPWGAVLIFWTLKVMVEYWATAPVLAYYGLSSKMRYLFFFQPVHVLYIVVTGFLGLIGKYSWKDRKVK